MQRNLVRRGIVWGLVLGFIPGCAMELPVFQDAWVNRDAVSQALGWSVMIFFESIRISMPIMLITAAIGGAVGWFLSRRAKPGGKST